ncbi:hypothetical protein [Phaeacidiphilus oryzae]|uniref:hypothetical protein n=1 Tax=Phaeacidiphilus oryzae TaxID=348818 RepID=UPI00056D7158|nr:hypothetical protein [Phaeacidiphilus oryzae]
MDREGTPPLEPLPALTAAEGGLLDAYLAAAEALGRANPARVEQTYSALVAAQALAARAAELRDALELMYRRGERELHQRTLARALRLLDGERRAGRVALPPAD